MSQYPHNGVCVSPGHTLLWTDWRTRPGSPPTFLTTSLWDPWQIRFLFQVSTSSSGTRIIRPGWLTSKVVWVSTAVRGLTVLCKGKNATLAERIITAHQSSRLRLQAASACWAVPSQASGRLRKRTAQGINQHVLFPLVMLMIIALPPHN